MAYNPFDDALPVSTATGPQTVTDIRDNLQAMRDMVVGDFSLGWDMSVSGGSASEPAIIYFKKDASEWVRETLTWSGGKVTVCVYAFTSSGGSTWDTIGTLTITYDGSDNVTATTWS